MGVTVVDVTPIDKVIVEGAANFAPAGPPGPPGPQGETGPAGAQGPAGSGGPLTGTGFPEGVVTAPVGTEYVDTAATNGAIKWIKASGTGNTGWVVIFGDTGWRDITSTFEWNAIWGANKRLRVRRTTDRVVYMFGPSGVATNGSGVTHEIGSVSVLGSDWLPTTAMYFRFGRTGAGEDHQLRIGDNGALSAKMAYMSHTLSGEGSFVPRWNSIWPSTLPGTAA